MRLDIIAQGKGGVGKTACAAYLTQHLMQSQQVLCIDADSNNPSFSAFKAFDARKIFLAYGDEINPREFDAMIEAVAESDADTAVIDVGSSSFGPLLSYMRQNEVIPMLEEMGHTVRFHVIIAGGASLDDTVASFAGLCKFFPDVELVVWLNGYFGEPTRNGKRFDKTPIYEANAHRIFGVVEIPPVKKDTFGHDLEAMMGARQTFDERIALDSIPIMTKQRLKMVWRDLQGQMVRGNL
jgi:hypothetical protein